MINLRKLIIEWDNKYPLDREFRKKHNLAFNSEQHRAVRQIDVYMEWLEEQLYTQAVTTAQEWIEKDKEFEKGTWLRPSKLDEETANDFFDKIDVSTISKEAPIQFE